MSDIVKRLNGFCVDWDGSELPANAEPMDGIHCDVLLDAATEIVRLRSELEDVKSSYEEEFEFLLVKLTNSSNAELVEAANEVIASASDTYKKRNGHLASFEDDSGEKCWIVPFDAVERLRAALKAEEESR